jgi:hypothetical protein
VRGGASVKHGRCSRTSGAEPHKRRNLRQHDSYSLASRLGKALPALPSADPSIRRAGAAASAAAFFVVALLVGIAAGASQAAAQGRLEAEYTATLAGIPIGRGNWIVDVHDDQYSAAASGTTTGVLRFFTGARGTASARGATNGGGLLPASYGATIIYGQKIDDVHIALAGGNVTDYTVEPPLPPNPERIAVSDTDRRGVFDPMTSMLARVPGTGDPVSPAACARRVAVFDGRVRYDLHSDYKRMETVKAEKGYEGPVAVCGVYFTPISGYVPSRPAIRYLIELRDAEVWLAPIAGTRVLVPFRFSMPTPLGTGLLLADAFISVAQPPRPMAKTQ